MPLVLGREFTERDGDGAPLVGIVNETFAKYFFGTENPIGRRFGWRVLEQPGRDRDRRGREGLAATRRCAQGTTRGQRDSPLRLHAAAAEQRADRHDRVRARHAGRESACRSGSAKRYAQRDAALPVYNVTTMDSTIDEALFTRAHAGGAVRGVRAAGDAARRRRALRRDVLHRRRGARGKSASASRSGRSGSTVVWLVLREVAMLIAIGIGDRHARRRSG